MNNKAQAGLSLVRNLVIVGIAIVLLVSILFTFLGLLMPADMSVKTETNFDNLMNTIENLEDNKIESVNFDLDKENVLIIKNQKAKIESKIFPQKIYEICGDELCFCLFGKKYQGDAEPIKCVIPTNVKLMSDVKEKTPKDQIKDYEIIYGSAEKIRLFYFKKRGTLLEYELIN